MEMIMMKETKKIISVLLAIVLTMTIIPFSGIVASAEALTGTCGDNLTWNYDDSTGVLTISGTGEMYNYDGGLKTPWYDVRKDITEIIIGNGVTSVGKYAFQKTGVDVVTISDTVETIGEYGFYGSTGIIELNFGANVKTIGKYAFNSMFKLEKLNLPEGLVTIGDYSFSSLNEIEELIIPDSVVTIGDYAFSYCKVAKYLYIGENTKTFPVRAFQGWNALERIQVSADNSYYSNDEYGVLFNKNKTKLVLYPRNASYNSYTIPDSVKTVGDSAFVDCNNLTSITLGQNIENIETSAFAGMDNITSFELPDGVKTIGNSAFRGCKNLNNIVIPDTVTSIGRCAFEDCTALTTINYAGTEEQWNKIRIDTYENEILLNAEFKYLYGHICEFGYWTITKVATCTEAGSETRSCSCGAYETREIPLLGHSAGEWETTAEATCTATGSRVKYCTTCGVVVEEEAIPTTAHIDENGDNFCDNCNNNLSDNSDDNNDDVVDSEKDCDHICHKSGILGFFWKIGRFFSKIFRTNQYCDCGVAHY